MPENKLGITDSAELARIEEKISKRKAVEMFESGYLESLEAGTLKVLLRFIGIFLMKYMILPVRFAK